MLEMLAGRVVLCSGGSSRGSRASMEPPFWLDLVLRDTGDRLNGTLLLGWRAKKASSVAHLCIL